MVPWSQPLPLQACGPAVGEVSGYGVGALGFSFPSEQPECSAQGAPAGLMALLPYRQAFCAGPLTPPHYL